MRKPKWLFVAALPAVLLLGGAAFAFFRAQQALEGSKAQVAAEGRYAAELRTLGRMENPGFEAIASSSTYASGAFYKGKLYVSGPSGLFVFGSGLASGSGVGTSLLKTYRVGLDLPAAPLGQAVVGRLRGMSEPELLIATHGEGVLVFTADGSADGRGSFQQIRPVDAGARDVTAVAPLPSGELLMGTRKLGVLVWRGDSRVEAFDAQLAGLAVTALAADATGFWVGTRDRGLLHWHGGQVDGFVAERAADAEAPEGLGALPDNEVEAIAVRGDRVYAGTPLGVEEFVDGRPARVLARNVFAHALYADGKQMLVGSMDEGIARVSLESSPAGRRNGAVWADFSQPGEDAGPAEQFLSASTEDGGAVLAILRGGLRQGRGDGGWADLAAEPEVSGTTAVLTDGDVSALAFDAQGRLWVGYFDRGLDILTGGERVVHPEDDRLFCVNRMVLDPRRKTMAVATANGLVLFDAEGKPRQTLTKRDGLIADHVTDVAFEGETMIAATPAGLTFIDGGGARSLYAFEGLVNNHVYALGSRPNAGAAGAELLAGTLGGVSELVGESVRRNLTAANSGLQHNWVTAIVPVAGWDSDSEWMIGTYGAGVMRLDRDGRFHAMDGVTGKIVVNPNAMLVTGGHVLAGTLGDGLWVGSRANGHWRRVTAGLPSENVTALAERDGEIYVGTDNGLVRIAERLLD